MKSALLIALLIPAVVQGQIKLSDNDLQPGRSFDLSGNWLYKPGYAVGADEKPETESTPAGFLSVPVPQLLNRIHWWLDDSADFNQHETERLQKLGFDTEKAEDGWYHLQLDMPEINPDRHFFLEFDGVAMKCKVFCNGQLLGGHQGMFSRFSFEITRQLKPGANLIAVFVSMEKSQISMESLGQAVTVNLTAARVKTMSKGMYGRLLSAKSKQAYDLQGIWQPVKLKVTGPAKLDDVWFVPSLTGADVHVEGHAFSSAATMELSAKWFDAGTGELFAQAGPVAISGSFSQTLQLRHVKPKLWTPADPNLYRLEVTLSGEAVMDSWTQKVGFRTFEVHGNQLLLNGHPYWLRGANHLPYGKNPWDPDLPRRLIQFMHDDNLRVTRTHGTPWNELWLNAADEIGLGVSIEGMRPWAFSGKVGLPPPDQMQLWLAENDDVIKRCRNHPSVLIYTAGNEMLLKDYKDVEKWKLLSEVVKQTRRADPTRPVISSSDYQRDPEFYKTALKPNGVDDGDMDDLHRYNNWYFPSSFVSDSQFIPELARNAGRRPLIGQEMSTGYPDLDSGLPTLGYTRDFLTPQAWVGIEAYPGSDPAVFLEHHRAVTKRWAEQLRFQRDGHTAGFMLFATECWFSHSYDAQRASPYPVCEAMREADAPVGLALETGRRRFYGGEKVDTAVFISNDDEKFRDLHKLKLEAVFLDASGSRELARIPLSDINKISYYKTARVPVHFIVPQAASTRQKLHLALRLTEGETEISHTTDHIEVFEPVPAEPALTSPVTMLSLGPELRKLAGEIFKSGSSGTGSPVILIGSEASSNSLGKTIMNMISNGATAIVFSSKLVPGRVPVSEEFTAEFADFTPIFHTPLASGMEEMDIKWWGRKGDWRTFVASRAHRLPGNAAARELIRYIPPHGYISPEKQAEQYWTVLSEVPMGRGRLWICDLDLEQAASVDPAAHLFALNLLSAAADPDSTKLISPIPSHGDLMKGRMAATPPP